MARAKILYNQRQHIEVDDRGAIKKVVSVPFIVLGVRYDVVLDAPTTTRKVHLAVKARCEELELLIEQDAAFIKDVGRGHVTIETNDIEV